MTHPQGGNANSIGITCQISLWSSTKYIGVDVLKDSGECCSCYIPPSRLQSSNLEFVRPRFGFANRRVVYSVNEENMSKLQD